MSAVNLFSWQEIFSVYSHHQLCCIWPGWWAITFFPLNKTLVPGPQVPGAPVPGVSWPSGLDQTVDCFLFASPFACFGKWHLSNWKQRIIILILKVVDGGVPPREEPAAAISLRIGVSMEGQSAGISSAKRQTKGAGLSFSWATQGRALGVYPQGLWSQGLVLVPALPQGHRSLSNLLAASTPFQTLQYIFFFFAISKLQIVQLFCHLL